MQPGDTISDDVETVLANLNQDFRSILGLRVLRFSDHVADRTRIAPVQSMLSRIMTSMNARQSRLDLRGNVGLSPL
jgi:hypothetical protein